jgi:hypothetical protein
MKEAFEVMGNHALLTLFLGAVFVVSLAIICDTISVLFSRIPNKVKRKKKDDNPT